MELAGRTVMVTGASGGIGEPLCAALIAAGARVLAVGRNDVGSANALNAQLRGLKPGQAVMLLVRRGGGTQYVTVDPGEE